MADYRNIGNNVTKFDSLALATGNSIFADDVELKDVMHLKILYSPHAHAIIKNIDTSEAEKLDGVIDIFHHGNVPRVLHTSAGQGFPEPSPYDTALFNKKMRYVGDRVAMIVAETPEIAENAAKLVQVEYETLPAVFEMEDALTEGAPILHDDDQYMPIPVFYEPSKNYASGLDIEFGDLDKGFDEADHILEHTFKTQQTSHCAIEPHAAKSWFDELGRLVIITTTQVPFHARRIVSRTLDIPIQKIRVIKPRIGGGFGGKQEVILEPLVALASWKHKRPSQLILTRDEVFISARTRNPMTITLKTGFKKDGTITALDMYGLLNTGAYGSHALTVLSNAGAKVLPLFNKIENMRFIGRSVYTNRPVGGAYRGYGATKGYFALNQHIDMLAREIGVCPLDFIKKWHIQEGETSEIFKKIGEGTEGVAQIINSCALDECIDKGKEAIDWDNKRGKQIRNGDLVTGIGFGVSMQGSGIPHIDMGSAHMKMNEDGSFYLFIGATDIGTGSDTIMAQIAAEVLDIPAEKINVLSSDTDMTPFDVGAYASSTTYVTGTAVVKCAEKIKEQLFHYAELMLDTKRENIVCENGELKSRDGNSVTFEKIGYYSMYTHDQSQIQASASNYGTESPPPFAAAFAEVQVDIKTGKVHVVKFVTAADCGQPINPKFVEGQVEGATLNGMSYALTEDYILDKNGKMKNPTFWDYKIYTAPDMPEMVTIIAESHEKTGPYGAKSIGEIGINGPIPAIANAIYDAIGVRMFKTPYTPEYVYNRMKEEGIV